MEKGAFDKRTWALQLCNRRPARNQLVDNPSSESKASRAGIVHIREMFGHGYLSWLRAERPDVPATILSVFQNCRCQTTGVRVVHPSKQTLFGPLGACQRWLGVCQEDRRTIPGNFCKALEQFRRHGFVKTILPHVFQLFFHIVSKRRRPP